MQADLLQPNHLPNALPSNIIGLGLAMWLPLANEIISQIAK